MRRQVQDGCTVLQVPCRSVYIRNPLCILNLRYLRTTHRCTHWARTAVKICCLVCRRCASRVYPRRPRNRRSDSKGGPTRTSADLSVRRVPLTRSLVFAPRKSCARCWRVHGTVRMRRPNNLSTALRQLADPVLHFGFIQDADYTMVIPSSLAYHAAKEAEMRARLLPNERRFPPKNPDRLRAQLTTVHISPHGDAADFHAAFKRLVRDVCGFPGRLRLLIGSTDRWWPKHYSRLGLGLGFANPIRSPNPKPKPNPDPNPNPNPNQGCDGRAV